MGFADIVVAVAAGAGGVDEGKGGGALAVGVDVGEGGVTGTVADVVEGGVGGAVGGGEGDDGGAVGGDDEVVVALVEGQADDGFVGVELEVAYLITSEVEDIYFLGEGAEGVDLEVVVDGDGGCAVVDVE